MCSFRLSPPALPWTVPPLVLSPEAALWQEGSSLLMLWNVPWLLTPFPPARGPTTSIGLNGSGEVCTHGHRNARLTVSPEHSWPFPSPVTAAVHSHLFRCLVPTTRKPSNSEPKLFARCACWVPGAFQASRIFTMMLMRLEVAFAGLAQRTSSVLVCQGND